MSVVTLDLTAEPSRRTPKWRQLRAALRQRPRSRNKLRMLADREIWDPGLMRAEAGDEARKSLWRG